MSASPDLVIADRYRLAECVGVGGMGEVWKAQDLRFESKYVAVKLLKEDESLQEDARNRRRSSGSSTRKTGRAGRRWT